MNTATITLITSSGRISINLDGVTIGSVKDGGQIARNTDRVLRENGVLRSAGYAVSNGTLTAPAVVLA